MKLRLLCLHSFRLSGDSLRKQMAVFSNFASSIDDICELHYMDGSLRCDAEAEGKLPPMLKKAFGPPYYEWWNARQHHGSDALVYDGMQATLDKVAAHVAAEGPFDGVLGFSQGGSLAHLLCVLAQRGAISMPPSLFCVVISGRASRHHEHLELMEAARKAPLKLPLCVMYGGKDTEVPPQETRALMETIDEASLCTIFLPEGGHRVPNLNEAQVQAVRAFLEARREQMESANLEMCMGGPGGPT